VKRRARALKNKKTIKLVNDERLNTRVISSKSCETGTDHCYSVDNAECSTFSIDVCAIKDFAACYNWSTDICALEEDIYACHNGQSDYT